MTLIETSLMEAVKGELINIDARGNRVAFLCYGPENVLILAGMNKIVSSVEEGIERTRRSGVPNRIKMILIGEELGY